VVSFTSEENRCYSSSIRLYYWWWTRHLYVNNMHRAVMWKWISGRERAYPVYCSRVISRGDTVPIVEKLTECMGMVIPLSKCLRTHYGRRHCKQFSGQNAPDCSILQIQSQQFFGGWYLQTAAETPRCLDPDTNFRLARQRSHCSCFMKRPHWYCCHSFTTLRYVWCQ